MENFNLFCSIYKVNNVTTSKHLWSTSDVLDPILSALISGESL